MQLPADITDFTGRELHVKHLCDLLSAGRADDSPGAVPVALVAGAGGLGKTTLAIHAAHRMRAHYPDGQLYVDLLGASPQPLAPADVLARFLRDLGVKGEQIPVSQEERGALYRTRLNGRRMLIVLDNARDAAQVRPLLPGSAACAVIVTSRSRLPDLVGGGLVHLDVLDDSEALTLFSRIVGAQRAAAEPDATAELLVACAGLPLAIRICAARLAARSGWTIRTLAGRISDEHRRLDEMKVGDLAVRASFEVSFSSLPAAVSPGGVSPARAFRMLGLWQGPSIGLSAAAALLGEPEDKVADALEFLVDAHLLESPAPDRYAFHDLLRVYAAERAEADEPAQARAEAANRVLAWYLYTTEAAGRVISPNHLRVPLGTPPASLCLREFRHLDQALVWCETERDCLAAAVRQASDYGEHEIAWKLPAAAMSFYYRRSHWADWVAVHEIGLQSARRSGDKLAEAWMLNNLGLVFGQQHRDQAVECFEQALALCQELGDTDGETRAANNVAFSYFQLRRFNDALKAAQRSLVIQRRGGRRYGEGIALGHLGGSHHELGNYDKAVHYHRQALAIFRELDDPNAEADALNDLGEAYLSLNRIRDAVSCLSQSLAIRRDIGDRYGQAVTLQRLGLAERSAGRQQEARESFTEALRVFEEVGDEPLAAEARSALAALAASVG
jgi:tetratricopeptide (TPR) repeat protein